MKFVNAIEMLLYAYHKNHIGTSVDEKLHAHLWTVIIKATHDRLSRNYILFNFKTISSFVSDLLEDKNINEVLENTEKYVPEKLLPYVVDIPTEPTNAVIELFLTKLIGNLLVQNDQNLKGIEIEVSLDKEDGMKEQYLQDKKKNSTIIIRTHSSCKETF